MSVARGRCSWSRRSWRRVTRRRGSPRTAWRIPRAEPVGGAGALANGPYDARPAALQCSDHQRHERDGGGDGGSDALRLGPPDGRGGGVALRFGDLKLLRGYLVLPVGDA